MKRILLFSVIILSTFNTYANTQWVLIGINEINHVFFIDADSIQKSGDSSTYWIKNNFPQRGRFGDLSLKYQETTNCRTRERTFRYMISYDDIDNNGKITNSGNLKAEWTPIPPDSVSWAVYKYVCNR
jgi:hypothetical protein